MDKQKYFLNFAQEEGERALGEVDFLMHKLVPDELCPFAAQAIFPYLFSFKNGSWFRWEKSKDAVVAQCPNPEVSVAFKITRKSKEVISAEVISQKKECLAGHKIGDIFKVSQVKKEFGNYDYCHLNLLNDIQVRIVSHSPLCRYYQNPKGVVSFENLAPRRFCLPAYYVTYPYALSLLYDGNDFNKLGKEYMADISCPNNSQVKIRVRTQRNIFTPLLNLLEKSLRWIGFPKDVLDKTIKVEILGLAGDCPRNLEEGQRFNFNLYDNQEICPAVFYNLFPYLIMFSRRFFPYWTKENRHIDIHCPDAVADIVYRISIT